MTANTSVTATVTPTAIPGIADDTTIRVQNRSVVYLYVEVAATASPPARGSDAAELVRWSRSLTVKPGTGESVFVWTSEREANVPIAFP